jgi:hypothetical protein
MGYDYIGIIDIAIFGSAGKTRMAYKNKQNYYFYSGPDELKHFIS